MWFLVCGLWCDTLSRDMGRVFVIRAKRGRQKDLGHLDEAFGDMFSPAAGVGA